MAALPATCRPLPRLQRWAVILVVAMAWATPSLGQTPPERVVDVMERPGFAHATWAMEFLDLETGEPVFGVNARKLMVPGSTTKLLTMGTALEILGADHRFTTRVYRTGPIQGGVLDGDLVLVASGDPNLSGRERPDGTYAFNDIDHSYGGMPLDTDPIAVVRDLARQVAARGIRRVTGQVVVDASLFPEGERDGGTGVTMGPLVINDNVVDVVVTPAAGAGEAATVTVTPETAYLRVQAYVTTSEDGVDMDLDQTVDDTEPSHHVLLLTGTVPAGGEPVNLRWRVPEPSRFGEIVFAEALEDAGVRAIPRLASRAVDAETLAEFQTDEMRVAEHVSLPLVEEAAIVLKTSQNLHASNFPLLLGSLPQAQEGDKTGFDLEREWLESAGLDLEGAAQGDGAGARAHFSPEFMTRYLAMVASKPWASGFRAALPVLGRDGTLVEVQVESPAAAAGQVHAKTGTYGTYDPLHRRTFITGKGLAGYMTTRSGREIAFAVYLNNLAVDGEDPAAVAGQALGEIAAIAWEEIR